MTLITEGFVLWINNSYVIYRSTHKRYIFLQVGGNKGIQMKIRIIIAMNNYIWQKTKFYYIFAIILCQQENKVDRIRKHVVSF